MRKTNIYKFLFYILLIPYIFFVIYLFWPTKQEKQNQEPKTVQSTCEKELRVTGDVVEWFYGTPMPVDFSDFPKAKTYYTRITETVKRGANFAGYYSLVGFGVGIDNVGFAVVNLKTGKVIAYNPVSINYHLTNKSSYIVLVPVYAGQTREFYKIVNDKLELACTEESTKNMYGSPEDVL